MLRNKLSALICLLVLANCGSNTSTVENFSDYRLCYGLASLPTYNIHTSARKTEIAKRGVNCGDYADRIDEQIDKERVAKASRPVQNISTYDDGRLDQLERSLAQQCRSNGGTWLPYTKNCLSF